MSQLQLESVRLQLSKLKCADDGDGWRLFVCRELRGKCDQMNSPLGLAGLAPRRS
jgi:hypothetical protein